MARSAILVIESQPESAAALRSALSAHVEAVGTLEAGLALLPRRAWSAVVLSLDLPAADLAVARRVREATPAAAGLVLVTERPTMQLMVEASRMGAAGVFGRPLDAQAVAQALAESLAPPAEVVALDAEPAELPDDAVIGASPEMLDVFRTVGRIASSSATVLITGESGTGKEMVARAIHRNSARAAGPFVAINCAAIPENLLESELFGHEKGAFTGAIARRVGRFERASGGTLLLDEIGDMSLALQSKILRALQEREIERVGGEGRIRVDVRIVAATNRDLRASIAEGGFREDLYFRLAVVTLHLPRLAERGDDLLLLARHYVARFARDYRRPIDGIDRQALDRLRAHHWPGNIRELRNVLERAVLMAGGSVLRPEHLPLDEWQPPAAPADARVPLEGYSAALSMADVERLHLREVLRAVGGHMGRAAEVLGLHRNTLTRKVREHGLDAASPFS